LYAATAFLKFALADGSPFFFFTSPPARFAAAKFLRLFFASPASFDLSVDEKSFAASSNRPSL